MSQDRKKFKMPPKRYHPKGLTILYEDHDVIVIDKASGLLSVSTSTEKDLTVYALLSEYVKKSDSKSRNKVHVVHRLDQYTSGVLILAKTEQAKNYLQTNWKSFSKIYNAVVAGRLQYQEGEITSYLTENKSYKVYSVSDEALGRFSKTKYKVLKETDEYSFVEIDLLTGRKNQIRVHFADIGNPVLGDIVYGTKQKEIPRLMLHASKFKFTHPITQQGMVFEAPLPVEFNKFT